MSAAIDVRDLRFTYPGAAAETLHGVSFSVSAGEIFGFLGPSGAGKSTTQNVLIGLLRGYAGSATVAGQEIRTAPRVLYESLGVAFEFPYFFSRFTAMENLRYFASLYRGATRDPAELLHRFGLGEAAHQRVATYSKGMKTRLNLCRAFLNEPQIVFLDEPTTGLDPATARHVRGVIRSMRDAGTTVFLTTHNMQVADELCDRVAFIVDGTLPVVDSPYALRQQYGTRSVVVDIQTSAGPIQEEFPLRDLADNAAFLERLRNDGVLRVHSQEASLEDVFIATTGRGLSG